MCVSWQDRDWVVLHAGALFYVEKSKSTSSSFEAHSNLLLFSRGRRFLHYSSLWLDLLSCCFWTGFIVYIWKPINYCRTIMVVSECLFPVCKGERSSSVASFPFWVSMFVQKSHQEDRAVWSKDIFQSPLSLAVAVRHSSFTAVPPGRHVSSCFILLPVWRQSQTW